MSKPPENTRSKSRDEQAGGLTRRGLFRSIGVATVAASCVKQDPQTEAPTKDPGLELDGAFGLTPAALEFVLDGQAVQTQAEARTTLLELLRLELDATGTKQVCDRGACGACMVMVDGVARNSCMLLAHDVAGAEVTTVAGLATGGQLSKLQAAFVEHDALQCGFCTSGMLVSSAALLRALGDRAPTRAQVEDAIAGNLCRCGTYPHVVDAVLAAATGQAPPRQSELLRVRTKGEA